METILERKKYVLISRGNVVAHTDDKSVCKKFLKFRASLGYPECVRWVAGERKNGYMLKIGEDSNE